MQKRDELLKRDSCFNRATDDEPIFVLRANDETAPRVVREWASQYFFAKGGFAVMTVQQVTKYNEALALAAEMTMWREQRRDDT